LNPLSFAVFFHRAPYSVKRRRRNPRLPDAFFAIVRGVLSLSRKRDKSWFYFPSPPARGRISGWHLGRVQGEVRVGKTLTMERRPGLRFGWRTEELDPGLKIVQTCVEGPGSSAGKTLTITFFNEADGRTRVELSDTGWRDDDPHLPLCNTYWGEALTRLRSYLESSKR
jgi:uncharacterized protein YndB with AHSA1/START domain